VCEKLQRTTHMPLEEACAREELQQETYKSLEEAKVCEAMNAQCINRWMKPQS
jgi:hypothetical protein